MAPTGLLDLDDATARRLYTERLDERADTILTALADVAREHPGQPLAILCFENVAVGEECHRRWFADWLSDRHGLTADETDAAPAQQLVMDW